MKRIIKVGSRESKLALAQSNMVIEQIKRKHPEFEFQLIGIKTKGDAILDKRLDKIGGKGLFIKELEQALLSNEIDIAVHSMKDMPAELPEELVIAAVSEREDPRDALVTTDGKLFEELPEGAVVGTSSARREALLLSKRPDLNLKTLRGNVLTRLDKLVNREYDAIVLAAAGLKRLGLEDRAVQFFSEVDIIPAVGQGILAVEARRCDDVQYLIDSVNCPKAQLAVDAERAFMIRLNGGCSIPIAAHAIIEGPKMKVYGMLATEDKSSLYRSVVVGSVSEARQLGEELAQLVLAQMRK
mgnify:CR=1 FL=1